ncbi:unnamed protein product, partial [Owenia fusiformis]
MAAYTNVQEAKKNPSAVWTRFNNPTFNPQFGYKTYKTNLPGGPYKFNQDAYEYLMRYNDSKHGQTHLHPDNLYTQPQPVHETTVNDVQKQEISRVESGGAYTRPQAQPQQTYTQQKAPAKDKDKRTKRRYRCIILLVVLLLLLLIGAVVAIAILANNATAATASTTTAAPQAQSQSYQAEISYDALTFVPEYADKTSPEYKKLADETCAAIDKIYKTTALDDNYQSCKVTDMKNGSVIVIVVLVFKTDSQSEVEVSNTYGPLLVAAIVQAVDGPFKNYSANESVKTQQITTTTTVATTTTTVAITTQSGSMTSQSDSSDSSVTTDSSLTTESSVTTVSSDSTDSPVTQGSPASTDSSATTESSVTQGSSNSTDSSVTTESSVSTGSSNSTDSSVTTESSVTSGSSDSTDSSVT